MEQAQGHALHDAREFRGLTNRCEPLVPLEASAIRESGFDGAFQRSQRRPLIAEGSRVFCFGVERPADVAEQFGQGLPWPTVEAVAVLLGRVAESVERMSVSMHLP